MTFLARRWMILSSCVPCTIQHADFDSISSNHSAGRGRHPFQGKASGGYFVEHVARAALTVYPAAPALWLDPATGNNRMTHTPRQYPPRLHTWHWGEGFETLHSRIKCRHPGMPPVLTSPETTSQLPFPPRSFFSYHDAQP